MSSIFYQEKVDFVTSLEEIDLAMFNKLSGCVIDGNPIEPTYYTPDVDLKKEKFPSIIFYRDTPFPDYSRWRNDTIIDNVKLDGEGNVIEVDKRMYPSSMAVIYFVRTRYDKQLHGVLLNSFLAQTFTRGEYITINDINYSVDFVSASLSGAQYKDFGRVEKGERDFGETYMYRVNFLWDVHPRQTIKATQQIIANVQQT